MKLKLKALCSELPESLRYAAALTDNLIKNLEKLENTQYIDKQLKVDTTCSVLLALIAMKQAHEDLCNVVTTNPEEVADELINYLNEHSPESAGDQERDHSNSERAD